MIYLLRHAQTLWNYEMRKQGLNDSPLTPTGQRQALAYGRALASLIPMEEVESGKVLVHTSPLGRTRRTTQYLVDALTIPEESVRYEPLLIEFDYGDWSGLTNSEIESRFPGALDERESDKWFYQVPNGESYSDVEAKVDRWMDALPRERTIIVVTHSVVSRVIRRRFLDMDRSAASQLDHPQHLIYRLHQQRIDPIDCEPICGATVDIPG